MGGVAGEAIEHPSDLTKLSGHIIERKMVRVFSFHTFLTEECFEMVHYGSDAGAEMAAIYHSVIGTVKLHGSSI